MSPAPLEKDTCRDYVLPRLKAAGWTDDQIQEQFPITDGRIITVGKKHRRADALRADYVLEYRPGVPVAVVEAKREYAIPGKGLQQAKNYFVPAFGEGSNLDPARRCQGWARDLLRAVPGAADSGEDLNGIFRRFDADFFDLVIVDECHRGSAKADTPWRGSLDHFSAATQLGRTATPKRDETADSYEYFGDPLFEYSLAQGIEDGFLAPYRVRRVVLSPDAQGWAPEQGQLDLFGKEIPDGLYTTRHFERVVSLLTRTEAAAKHLTE